MATLEQQEMMGTLLRKTTDASYKLQLALFKFLTTANYFDEIPESAFTEAEQAMGGIEDILTKIRAAMVMYIRAKDDEAPYHPEP